jgi:hypothetical protein
MEAFVGQPEHVAVILASSKIDELLGLCIRSRLLPCPTGKDALLESDRGLGSFSNRIDLAHRLGIIPAKFAKALHLLRKIRNDFAHSYSAQNLNASPHKDRIADINRVLAVADAMPELGS